MAMVKKRDAGAMRSVPEAAGVEFLTESGAASVRLRKDVG